jgi:hypothetical protein
VKSLLNERHDPIVNAEEQFILHVSLEYPKYAQIERLK